VVSRPYRRQPYWHAQDDDRVALARKLVVALWRFVTTGEPLDGVRLTGGFDDASAMHRNGGIDQLA